MEKHEGTPLPEHHREGTNKQEEDPECQKQPPAPHEMMNREGPRLDGVQLITLVAEEIGPALEGAS